MSTKPISLTVASQAGKKPIKNIPATVQIDSKTTVEDVKIQLAAAVRGLDYNRIAILDPSSQSILKDRKALLVEQKGVIEGKEILVKDLGPQISWRTVFIVEYAGPILIDLAILYFRPYIYKGVRRSDSISSTQLLALSMLLLHFLKREYETMFVHKFSSSTMPAFNIFKNSAHYWALGGLNIGYWVLSPTATAAKPVADPLSRICVSLGLILYIFGESANLYTHNVLSKLRSSGGTERGIPKGFGFSWVTCPNYLFECIAWVGICLVTRSLSTAIFTAVGWWQMQQWAVGKEKRYRREFPETYKPKLYPLTPGVALPIRKSKPSSK